MRVTLFVVAFDSVLEDDGLTTVDGNGDTVPDYDTAFNAIKEDLVSKGWSYAGGYDILEPRERGEPCAETWFWKDV